jgi:plastocyanin
MGLNRLGRLALLVAMVVMVLPQHAGAGSDVVVDMVGSAFVPAVVTNGTDDPNQATGWDNDDAFVHTSTSDGFDGTSGPKLWDSGDIPGSTGYYAFTINTAGTFKYHCRIHQATMKGKVEVPMFSTGTSTVDQPQSVHWASFSIFDGYNIDVQRKKPGDTEFKDWKLDRTGTDISAVFTPKVAGTYVFRARTQKGSREDRASKWSPDLVIEVDAVT